MPEHPEKLHALFDIAEDEIAKALGYWKPILLASPEDPDVDSCSSIFAF